MSTPISCLRAALEEVKRLPDTDPDKMDVQIGLERIIGDRKLTEAQKLEKAKIWNTNLRTMAARKAVADKFVEEKTLHWENRTDGYNPDQANSFFDSVRDHTDPRRGVDSPSVEARIRFLEHKYMAKLNDLFTEYFQGWAFVRTKDTLDFQRELLGANSGNKRAKELVQQYREVMDELTVRLRELGVFVDQRQNYHPQNLSPGKLARDMDNAKAEMRALLDEKFHIIPEESAEVAMTTLMTRHTLEPGSQPLTMGRQLHYKIDDPDRLITFLNKYGEDDVIRQIQRQIRRMTRAIAAAEPFGPDPGRVINSVAKKIETNAASARKTKVEFQARQIEDTWNAMNGTLDTPKNVTVANVLTGGRAMMTPLLLGKVAIDILTVDPTIAVGQQTRRVGFGQAATLRARAMMAVLSPSMRKKLNDYYAAIEPAFWMGSPNSRFSPSPTSEGFAGKTQMLANAVYRLSGAWDAEQLQRQIVAFELSFSLGNSFRTAWNDLDPRLQQDFAAGGVTERVWNDVNRFGRVDEGGMFNWDQLPMRSGETMGAWFHKTLNSHVLRPDASTRALLMGGGRRGSLPGELAMTVTHYLNWPIEFARKAMYKQWVQGVPGFAVFAGSVYAAAMVSEQLRAITAGEPAFEWDSPELRNRALGRSGLLTPVGEWVRAAATDSPRGELTLGPMVDLSLGTIRSGSRAVQKHIDGETDRAKAEILRAAGRLTPNVSWFDMTVVQPTLRSFDEVLDPDYALRREQRFMEEGRVGY